VRARREQLLELNAVLVKACHHDARERYSSAEAMRGDLALLQRGESCRNSGCASVVELLRAHDCRGLVIALWSNGGVPRKPNAASLGAPPRTLPDADGIRAMDKVI